MTNYKIILLLVCIINTIQAQDIKEKATVQKIKHKNSGFIDFNGYYDTREYGELTMNILANLDRNIQYFSLTNF